MSIKTGNKNNIKEFCRNKYEKRKYCKDLPSHKLKNEELLQIWAKALEDDNLIKLYPIVCFGMVNVNQIFEYQIKNSEKEKASLLHIACKLNREDAIMLLLHNGADSRIKNSLGISPEEIALIENKIEILVLLQDI